MGNNIKTKISRGDAYRMTSYLTMNPGSKSVLDILLREAAISIHRVELDFDAFRGIFLFAWKEWPFFRQLYESGLLGEIHIGEDRRVLTMTLYGAVRAYRDFLGGAGDSDSERIKRISEDIIGRGFGMKGAPLIVFDGKSPNIYYLMDGYHRMIAYLGLIQEGRADYTPLTFVVAECPYTPIKFSQANDSTFSISDLRRQ